MKRDEFLELSDADQLKWLTEQTDAGREVTDICEELGCSRADLQGFGYTYALGNWHFMSMADRASVVAQN